MATEKHSIGPFSFTFRNGRVWWKYRQKHFGTRISASAATSHSLGEKLLAFFHNPHGAWSHDGLETFVRYFMSDIPGAMYWADHYSRVSAMVAKAA